MRSRAVTKLTFPQGAIIRTILADVPADALEGGATLFHEHLSLGGLPGTAAPNERPPRRYTENVELMREELRAAAQEGVRCIVDAGSIGDVDQLRKIAAAVRPEMHIVAAGGYFVHRRYPPEVATSSEDQLADKLAARAREERWGAFGEIGTSMRGCGNWRPAGPFIDDSLRTEDDATTLLLKQAVQDDYARFRLQSERELGCRKGVLAGIERVDIVSINALTHYNIRTSCPFDGCGHCRSVDSIRRQGFVEGLSSVPGSEDRHEDRRPYAPAPACRSGSIPS